MPVLGAAKLKAFLARAEAKPKPWQEEALIKTDSQWDGRRVFLYDHARGSGKTRLMAMMALMGMKQKGIRCVLVVVDRCDLATQAKQEFADFFAKCYKIPVAKQKTEQVPEVLQVSAASELQQHFDKLTEDSLARCVLVVTLQSFPHLQTTLPPALQEKTLVVADEVHRSHADRAFSEELQKAIGAVPRLLLFTGTASDRCLRLFGVREGDFFVPFHAVSEEEVAKRGMIFQLSHYKREFKQIVCDTTNLEKVAREQQLEPRLLQSMKALSNGTPAAIRLKAAVLWKEFQDTRSSLSYRPQMVVVAESRDMVLSYAEAFKSLAAQHEPGKVAVYGAFSGKLQHGDRSVDEAAYNLPLQGMLNTQDLHKKSDILVICDRFETGYDNTAVTLLGIDRRMSSDEKLVQVYSRANRRRYGKTFPKVIDFSNRAQDVERAVLEFAQPRRVRASRFEDVVSLSAELKEALPDLAVDAGNEAIEAAVRRKKESQNEQQNQDLAKKVLAYLKGRKDGVSRAEHGASQLMSLSLAQKIWNAMREHGLVQADVKQLEREIVEEYTRPKGIRTAGHLGFSGSLALPLTNLATPLQNMERRLAVERSAAHDGGADVVALQAVKDGLANGAAGEADAEEEEEQRARTLREMKACAERLRKPRTAATARLQKSSFDALHRLVSWAREAAEAKDRDLAQQMIDAGVEEIFRNRLHKGEPCEHQHCIGGLDALVGLGFCPRAAKMLKALRNLQQLHQEEKTHMKALLELCDFLLEECDARQADSDTADRAELWIFLGHDVVSVLASACATLPWSNRVAGRRALCKTFIRLQETVAAESEHHQIAHKEKLCSLAQLAREVQQVLCEACYAGKTVQKRKNLAGNLMPGELATIRRRWSNLPEDLVLILQRLGGPEAVVKLVQLAGVTNGWSRDFGQEVSKLWELVSDNEWTNVEWVDPDIEDSADLNAGDEVPALPALRRSFTAASRKRKAVAMEG